MTAPTIGADRFDDAFLNSLRSVGDPPADDVVAAFIDIELDADSSGARGGDLGLSFPSLVDGGAEISSLPSPPDLDHTGPDDSERLASSPPPPDMATTVADGGRDGLAQVAIMPPPIADDPWTPSAERSSADDNGVA